MYGIRVNKEIETFNALLMNKVKVSNKDYFQIIRSKKYASKYPHIQYNHLSGVNYIAIDIDNDVFNTLEETNLNPNLVVANSSNNKAHCYFRLNDFVGTTANSSFKAQKAMRLLHNSLNNYMNGDKAFNGMQAKNPLHSSYRVLSFSDQGYDFAELFDNIPDKHIYIYKPEIVETKESVYSPGRNSYIFEVTRFHAYKQKALCSSFEQFFNEVDSYAQLANSNLTEPLELSEIKYIVRSITNFTWSKYTGGDGRNKGVMELNLKGHNLTQQDKEILGANYTAKIKRENTEQLLKECLAELQAQGKKATQKAVAELSGKGIATVKRYWKQIK